MMTCRQLIEFLDSYLEGDLSPLRAAAFRFHLLLCRDCRQYLDTYRRTIEISRQAMQSDDPIPAEVPPRLIQAIRDSISKAD